MNKSSLLVEQNIALELLLLSLPKLPNRIRYYDDFDDKVRSIDRFPESDVFEVYNNGSKIHVDFRQFDSLHSAIFKGVFFYLISSELKVFSAYNHIVSLNHIDRVLLSELLLSGPKNIKNVWGRLFVRYNENEGVFRSIKALLYFFATYSAAGWSPVYSEFISSSLPSPFRDKYAGVRSGNVFLSAQEESLLVNQISELLIRLIEKPLQIQDCELEQYCMLVCSYLFGMRPIQIAQLKMRDVRIWNDVITSLPVVHLTFKMVKQKTMSKAYPLTRKINRDWVPLFVELDRRARVIGKSGDERLFNILSSYEVSLSIRVLATKTVGINVTATDLRHTAAQRLVDAGASQEEVAEFMGHSNITTCLVYYATSPTQAERVNTALGISPIYQQVVKIAHDKFISPKELARLKGDQQIAGVPHGIPIAGIGGCSTGQTSCPYNPITSCYGCSKFMPIADVELHKKVLMDLRCVVLFFEKSSRGDSKSTAFMQLKRTINQVQGVIEELGVTSA